MLDIHIRTYSLTLTVLLVMFSFLSTLGSVQAQNVTEFTPQNVFDLPTVNGSIKFSVNGTYTEAVLENDTWIFYDLNLNNLRSGSTLKFSAKDCNVTIHLVRTNYIRYTVEGVGEQVINLGLNTSRPTHHSEWSVINQNSVFFAVGKNWQLLSDNTLIVHDVLGTLTVVRYNYGYPEEDNRPLYLQHSIIILTGVAVAIIVTFATIIKLNNRRLP